MLRDESMHKSFDEGPLGRQLSAVVSSAMAKLVPDRYFKIGVQVGLRAGFFLQQAEQAYLLLDNHEQDPQTQIIQIGSPERLPFGRNGVDLLVLPFVLEYSQSPHRVIREACEVLAPEGYLAICGFNPWGAWAVRRFFRREEGMVGFLSAGRIQDWIKLLGLELKGAQMRFYRPPISNEKVLERMKFLEHAGDRWWPTLAGCYVLVAKKKSFIGLSASVRQLPKRSNQNRPLTARWSQSCARTHDARIRPLGAKP